MSDIDRDALRALWGKVLREQAETVEARNRDYSPAQVAEAREFLTDLAEAMETGSHVDDVKRKRLRAQGKPILRAV
ncbi:MAG: hypothetical protein AB7P23_06325 [Amphiplicatus sp.]